MNRRDIFKGIAGAAAATTIKSDGPGSPLLYQTDFTRYHPQLNAGLAQNGSNLQLIDPFYAAKQALVNRAQQERQLLEEQLERKQQSLARMKSVSDAYKRWMHEVYRKELRAINNRLQAYVDGIWSAVS